MEGGHIKTVLLLGRPGSGKGTQTELLAKKLGWNVLSSGTLFRNLREDQTPLGAKVRETYDAGQLFPAWFPAYLFQDALLHMGVEEGIIGEGFARAIEEAKLEDQVLAWLGRRYVAINLEVSDEEAHRRQTHRNQTDARPDSDTKEKVQARLDAYREHTAPVLEFFKQNSTLIEINGEQTPEQIADEIYNKLQPLL